MKYTVITFLLLLICTIGYPQDLWKSLKEMRKNYSDAGNLTIRMSIKIFEDSSSTEPLYFAEAEIRKSELNYSYRLGDVEMLMNERHIIVADHESKNIICSNRNLGSEKEFMENMNLDVDSILTFYEEPVYLGNENGLEKYRVKQRSGPITTIVLAVDKTTSLVRNIIYSYKTGQKVSIDFLEFNTAATIDKKIYSDTNYIRRVEGNWQPVTSLKGYNIINNGI